LIGIASSAVIGTMSSGAMAAEKSQIGPSDRHRTPFTRSNFYMIIANQPSRI